MIKVKSRKQIPHLPQAETGNAGLACYMKNKKEIISVFKKTTM